MTASWLLQKVTQSGVVPTSTPAADDALAKLVHDAKSNIDAVGQDFVKATNNFRDTLASLVSNPKDFGTVGIGKLIDALGDVIKAALDAAQGMFDLVLDLVAAAISAFQAILNTPLGDLPVVGELLRAAGMTKGLTIGGLVTLLVAFPTALGYKLAHLDPVASGGKHGADQSAHAGAGKFVDRDVVFFHPLQHADVGQAECAASAESYADGGTVRGQRPRRDVGGLSWRRWRGFLLSLRNC